MPRVVFHAHAAVENLGDRVIVEATREALRAELPGEALIFEDASPGKGSARHLLAAPLTPDTRRALAESDLVLIGGGELVGPFPEYLATGALAAAAGIPTVWLGVGGSVCGGRVDRLYTRLVLRCAEAVVTRGPHSFERLSAEAPGVRLYEGVDVSFCRPPPDGADVAASHEFGICLRGPERRDRMWDRDAFARLAAEIDRLAERGLRPVFFTFLSDRDAARIGSPNLDGTFRSDAEVHALVRERLQSDGSEELVIEGDLASAVRRLRGLRFLIGMRLHSLVLAAQCGVPFLALDYAPKIAELTDVLGASEWRVRPEEIGARIPALAARLLDPRERDERGRALRSACDALRARAKAQLAPVVAALRTPRARGRRLARRAAARMWERVAAMHAQL